VYVSLGTVFEDRPTFFRDAARAIARPGRRVVLSIGRIAPQALGALPAGVTAHAHVDQLAVLRRADLFVTHGGFNSVQEGLVAGVPLLVFPQMQEQAFNADRVAELGAGLRLRRPTPARIGALVDLMLIEPRFRAAAVRAGCELRAAVDLQGAVDAVLGAAAGPGGRPATR
jgi:MGT family glycosyltransferase